MGFITLDYTPEGIDISLQYFGMQLLSSPEHFFHSTDTQFEQMSEQIL